MPLTSRNIAGLICIALLFVIGVYAMLKASEVSNSAGALAQLTPLTSEPQTPQMDAVAYRDVVQTDAQPTPVVAKPLPGAIIHVDSPISPIEKAKIVSTSRPQRTPATGDGSAFLVPRKTPTPPATRGQIAERRSSGRIDSTFDGRAVAEEMLPSVKRYHLIGGSFSTAEAANDFARKMEAEGHATFILYPPAGSALQHRVSLFRGATREAVEARKQFLLKQGKKAGWIYEER